MSTILLGLLVGGTHLPDSVGSSFEGQIVSPGDHDRLVELDEVAGRIDDKVTEVSKGICVGECLTSLVDKTLALNDENGLNSDDIKVIHLAAESIFGMAGLTLPTSMVFPSFESADTYSAELKDKSEGFIKRIMVWLSGALQAISEALTSFWNKLTLSSKSIEEYAAKVNVKVGAVKGDLKDPKATLNMGSLTVWLIGKGDQVTSPDRHLVDTVARYEDFVHEWENHWKKILNFPMPSSISSDKQVAEMSSKIKDLAVSTAKESSDLRIEFIVNHYLELKAGSGEIPLLGATHSIEKNVDGKSRSVPVLTKEQMSHGISTAITSMKVMAQLKVKIDNMGRITDRVSRLSKSINVDDSGTVDAEQLKKSIRALSKACSVCAWGWSTTVPYFLKTVKASIRYIDASTKHYS